MCKTDCCGPELWSEFEVSMENEQAARVAPSLAPEHDWAAASRLIRPALRPVGTSGTDGRELRVPVTNAGPGKTIVKSGPAGLSIVTPNSASTTA